MAFAALALQPNSQYGTVPSSQTVSQDRIALSPNPNRLVSECPPVRISFLPFTLFSSFLFPGESSFFFSPFPLPAEGVSQSNHGSGPERRRFYEKGEPKGLSNLKSKHSMGAVSGGAFEMSSSHIQRRDVMSSYHKHSIQSRARPLWARRINEQASWSTVERSHATFSLLLFELV